MKTRTKIILGVSLALVLCGAAAIIIIGGAAVYFSREINLPERVEKMKKAKTDGIEFAKTTDQNGCMEKGFSLKPAADSFDISNVTFVKECLNASRPTGNFCDGVPFMLKRDWFEDQCRTFGENNASCVTAFIAKRDYCQMDGKK